MKIEITEGQALIIFQALADDLYRTCDQVAPCNRNKKRIKEINELHRTLGKKLIEKEIIGIEYYNAVVHD